MLVVSHTQAHVAAVRCARLPEQSPRLHGCDVTYNTLPVCGESPVWRPWRHRRDVPRTLGPDTTRRRLAPGLRGKALKPCPTDVYTSASALPERVVERAPLLHAAEHDELGADLHLHRGPEARDQPTILSHRDDTQPGT